VRVDEPVFAAGGRVARGLREVTDDLAALHRPGFWAVLVTFEGAEIGRASCRERV